MPHGRISTRYLAFLIVGMRRCESPEGNGDAPLTLRAPSHDSCVGRARLPFHPARNIQSMSEPPPNPRGEHLLATACACRIRDAEGHGDTAPAMDPVVKGHLLMRLQRLERQIRGIQTMLMDDDYCAHVMTEIAFAHRALRGAGREVIRNHLRYCMAAVLLVGPEPASEMLDQVVEMVHRLGR